MPKSLPRSEEWRARLHGNAAYLVKSVPPKTEESVRHVLPRLVTPDAMVGVETSSATWLEL